MTRAEFLRICAGLAAAPLLAARDLRASTSIRTWSYHPGEGGDSGGGSDGGGENGCGGSEDNGTAWSDSSDGSGGCGESGNGGRGGDEGGGESECDERHPSPENATAVLGLLGAAAAYWPHLKAKLKSFRD